MNILYWIIMILWHIGRVAFFFLIIEGLYQFSKLLTDRYKMNTALALVILIISAVSVLVYIAVDLP